MKMIFLSASIPTKEQDQEYKETADIIAIRDAVRALATVVIPNSTLIWGGHPSITPLIRYVLGVSHTNENDHVILYQSRYFEEVFPADNSEINNIKFIDRNIDEQSSINDMRLQMIKNHQYNAGIFIGGMKGVEEEFKMFQNFHPAALVLPIASTGGAALKIFNSMAPTPDSRLKNQYAYMALFRSLLVEFLN